MKHLFVPYELAVKLKEKGFDEQCAGYFKYKELICIWNDDMNPAANSDVNPHVAAPLYQQVVDWFWDKYNLIICIIPVKEIARDYPMFEPSIWKSHYLHFPDKNSDSSHMRYKNYYEALTKAIEEALKLI